MMLGGASGFNSLGSGDCAATAGEALVIAADVPGSGESKATTQWSWVSVPRRLVQDARIDMKAISVLPRSPQLSFLSQYVAWLTSGNVKVPENTGDELAEHVADLLLLTLGAKGDVAEIARGRGLMAARYDAVRADIRAHLTDGDLRLEEVAHRQGISPGYLRALFDKNHSRFTDFVLSERLSRAHALLVNPRNRGRTVADIAYSCGFNDLSYFNRAFKRRFGMTPREARPD
jgi:AraC-like DNA-binding protein